MNHEFRKEKFIGCDPRYFEARLATLDAFPLSPLSLSKVKYSESEKPAEIESKGREISVRLLDDEDEYDAWGDPLPQMQMAGSVACIPIKGIIATGYPSIYQKFGFCDLDVIAEQVQEALGNPGVKGIALMCDSPGGTLRALPEFAAMIAGASLVKPIAARVDGLGCSACYYAIAGASLISAAPSCEMVNIGVYQVNYDESKRYEAFGIGVEVFKSGKYKAAGYPGTSLSDAQKSEIQGTVDQLGADFRSHVSASRKGANPDDMQGQTFLGSEAVKLGFADDDSPTATTFLARFKTMLGVQL